MPEADELIFKLDRASFFHIGRALHRGIGSSLFGKVRFTVRDGTLLVESDWVGGEIPCTGKGTISAEATAKAFCALITTRREKEPSGIMELVFRPALKEIAIDRRGIKARYDI